MSNFRTFYRERSIIKDYYNVNKKKLETFDKEVCNIEFKQSKWYGSCGLFNTNIHGGQHNVIKDRSSLRRMW